MMCCWVPYCTELGGFDESFSYPGKGAVGLDFDVSTRAWLSGKDTNKRRDSSSITRLHGYQTTY